jgi:ATP-dependent Clp protease ATP-binding subunit ClpA
MTISPRLKRAFQYAFQASRELGHSYVGPEHVLIGLAAVPDSIAGTLLKKYGVTAEALRQKVVKVVGKGAEDGRVDAPTNTPTLDKFGRQAGCEKSRQEIGGEEGIRQKHNLVSRAYALHGAYARTTEGRST